VNGELINSEDIIPFDVMNWNGILSMARGKLRKNSEQTWGMQTSSSEYHAEEWLTNLQKMIVWGISGLIH
jgi:hypothetical protein